MFAEDKLAEIIDVGSEVMVYMHIDHIGGFIWRMNHDMADGRIPIESHRVIDEDIARARPQQVSLVKCLTRFGLEKPVAEDGTPTAEYWAWYRWWNGWHKDMPDEEWDNIQGDIKLDMSEKEIARCRPEGSWNGTVVP